ncbi:DUF4435 domain-containing protein [Paenibacillus auburnensis]|uniref:DUF4435 domain-containing protein n=1 Tax=Paenibacillus auburnensis TaxID=2905649 RepID=UPI003C6E1F01
MTLKNTTTLILLIRNTLIDRDYKTDEELSALSESGIYALEVAEIENLIIVEEVISEVAKILELNVSDIFPAIKVEF